MHLQYIRPGGATVQRLLRPPQTDPSIRKLRQRRGANGEAEFTLYVDRADLDAARAAVADLSALSAKYL